MKAVLTFVRELALMVFTMLIIITVLESAKIIYRGSPHCKEEAKMEAAK